MDFLSSVSATIIDWTATAIVFAAVHIPFLAPALLGVSIPDVPEVQYSYPRPQPTQIIDVRNASMTPPLATTSTSSRTWGKYWTIPDIGDIAVDSNCPSDVISVLLENGLTPEIPTITCKYKDEFLHYSVPAKNLDIAYSHDHPTSEFDDMGRVIYASATLFSSGELYIGKEYYALRNALSDVVTTHIEQSFSPIPFSSAASSFRLEDQIKGPNKYGQYCGTYRMLTPFVGTVSACASPGQKPTAMGKVEWEEAKNYQTALAAALRYVPATFSAGDSTLDSRQLAEQSSSPESYQTKRVFFDQEGNFWVFYLDNGYINSSRFIKVTHDGEVSCITGYGLYGAGCSSQQQ